MSKIHIPGLDGLRGVACLLIVVGHFLTNNYNLSHEPHWLVAPFSQFWCGVDFFFVLSGFVIFLSLAQLRDRTSSPFRLTQVYFTSRAFRILPVYILLLVGYIFIPWGNGLINDDLFNSSVPSYVYLFFGQSWWMVEHHRRGAMFVAASWSLCAEVFLYVVSYLLVILTPRKHLATAMIVAAVISFAERIHVSRSNLFAAYMLPTCRMDGFMFGGLIALLYLRDGLTSVKEWVVDLLILAGIPVFAWLIWRAEDSATRLSTEFSYGFFALFFGVIMIKIIKRNWGFGRYLTCFGVISYFVYLFHFPLICAMGHLQLNVLLGFVLMIAALVTLGTLSWRYIEAPLIERGRCVVS